MAEMNDPYQSTKARTKTKGLSWSSWNIPEGMSESEALIRRERTRKSNRHMKHHDVEQLSRLPFDEMFLFGSHPESDVLSISQCPGCARRYKTQWLHNYHWEVSSSGDYLCSLTKSVIIPHRSSSKSDHHGHHHRESSKSLDAVHLHNSSSHPHSKQNNNLNVNPKLHHSSSSSSGKSSSSALLVSSKNENSKSSSKSGKTSLSSSSNSSSSSSSKPPLMTKAKAKMFPPTVSLPTVTNQSQGANSSSGGSIKLASQSSSNNKSQQGRLSSASTSAAATGGGGSYTLSIPSEDTGQNESVESLLQSNKSYSNGSSYGSKPIQIIATAVQKSSGKSGNLVVEGEYEQMKFYSDSYSEKKSKTTSGHSSHGHGHSHSGSNHGHGHSHSSHSHGHSHGHSHSHSSKSSNENDGTGVLSPSSVSTSSSQVKSSKSSSSNSTILQSVTTNPSLLNFKIPLKSKSNSSSSGGGGGSVPSGSSHLSPAATSSSSSSSSSQNSSKSKSKLSPKPSLSSPHYDSHRSPLHTSSGTGLSGSSTVTTSASHHHSSASTGSGLHSSSGGLSGSSTAQGGGSAGTSPAAYKSPGQLFPVESPAKVEVKNEDLSPPPAKKKKKKKSKNEPRKVLPLKDRLFDPDQHCGVSNADSNVPCTRSLTCKTHSMALRRAVPGRSLGFDQLLAEHKKARDAEKAAKVALEQQQQGEMSPTPVFSPSSITPNSSSSGVTKTLSKGKLKSMDGNSGGVPSPLGASSLSNVNNTRSVPNSSSAQSSNSKTQQSLSYLQQAVTSPLMSPTVPKLEIISDTKSSLRLSTASPTHLNQLSSPKDPNSLMYESDEFPSRSPITGYKIPSSKSGSGSASSSNYKIGPSSSLMSPSDLACESSSPKYPTNSSSLKSSGYSEMGYGGMETETDEPEIPQDPISAAIEMASAASALDIDSLLNDNSPDYSDYGVNQSQGVGSSSVPATSPFGFSAVGSANTGYSTALHQQNQSQTYSLTNSAFSNYSAASSTPDYQTCSFHSDTTDYQGEVSVSSSGYQQQIPSSLYPVAPNYSSAYTTYSQPQSSVSTMYQNPGLSSRYSASPGSVGAVFPGPTMFPTSNNSVYSGVTSSSSVYHPAGNPLYAATTSTLFPTEPPVFSIIEDLFSENPVSSIPPTGNHNLQIDPGGAGSNPDGFLKPFLSGSPAATPSGILLGASSSLSLNTSTASTGLHLNPNSESLGLDLNSVSAFLELGMNNGDNGQPSSPMDGNSQKRAQSQIKRIKKLLAIQEKMNNIENNPEEYLVFHDLDNTEQAFVTIAALKEPVVKTRTLEETEAMKKSENGNENTTDSSEFDLGETNENGKVNLLKRNLIKRKMWSHFDAYAPFETQKQPSNTRNRDKGPLRKKIKLKKDKAEGKLSLVPYTGEPDRLLSAAVENDTQGAGAEAAKAIQMTVKSLGNYKGSEVGKKRRNLEKKYEELAEGEKEGEGRKESKMENFETKLGDWINDPHDFHTDVFSRIRRFRMKDILRHINNNNINSSDDSSNHTINNNNNNNCNTNSSSLNYEKRQGQEKRPMIQARNDVPALDSQQPHPHSIPARDTPEHPAVHNEIESFIDTIPSIDVEDPHSNTCRQL